MYQMDKKIDIVNENDEVVGQCSLVEKHEHGYITRNVAVFIQDSDGKFIISKRALTKSVEPGLYDVSVCGHVDAGENYMTAALRELEEELGITAPLQELAVFYREFPYKGILMKHFTWHFRGRSDSPIVLSDEVAEYHKFSPEELLTRFHEQPELFTYSFAKEFGVVEEALAK